MRGMSMKTINLCSGQYEVTLLTKGEYMEHRNRIPLVNDWWWLRSPGYYSFIAAYVDIDGSVDNHGRNVGNVTYAVRPTLKSMSLNLPIGEHFIALGNRWIMIDNCMAISQDVITHRRYDTEKNVWETSELKQWLEEWAKEADAIEELSKKRVGTWHRFKATQRSYFFVCNSCGSICPYLTRCCPNCGVEYIGEEPPKGE